MNFITFSQLNNCISDNIHKIPRDVDLIVGIPRSGSLVAYIVGLTINIPIMDLSSLVANVPIMAGTTRRRADWIAQPSDAKHILLVDDGISTGEAMKSAKSKIASLGLQAKVTTCAVYALPTNTRSVDCYFAICNQPRMFEWNYMHHWGLQYACMDIDGVLCVDPGIMTGQIEKYYINFLNTAVPKIIPTKKVGYLVTSRREKYRSLTESWLKEQKVDYDQLIMLDDAINDVMTNKDYGIHKGQVYRETNCFLFIESNREQAIEICNHSKKQVFCTDTHELISPESVLSMVGIAGNDFKITTKHMVKKIIHMLKQRNKSSSSKPGK